MGERLGCKFCFRTLDPLEPDEDLRTFVKCATCGALYHQACWRNTQHCLDCAGAIAQSTDVLRPNPLRVAGQRKPLQHEAHNQNVIRLDSRPPYTKIAISAVAIVAAVVMLWRSLPALTQEAQNTSRVWPNDQSATATLVSSVILIRSPQSPTNTARPSTANAGMGMVAAETTTPTPGLQLTPTPSDSDELMAKVTAETLNIRAGPGTEYAKNGVLRNGDQVPIVGKNNGWWQIRLQNGDLAWISMNYAPAQGSSDQIPDLPAPPLPTREIINTPVPESTPIPTVVTTDNRSTFTNIQGANGWSYLMEDGRNSGQFRTIPQFDGSCWHSDNWEPYVRICADGEVHPGQSGRIAYQWRVANSGQLRIDVHAHKIDTRCGDGVWVGTYRVADERTGPRSLGDFHIGGGDNQGKTASYSGQFDQGNLLMVMVDIRGDSNCDMTRLLIDVW